MPTKPYPLGPKDRQVVDETFDKLHDQGKMGWTTKATPFRRPRPTCDRGYDAIAYLCQKLLLL